MVERQIGRVGQRGRERERERERETEKDREREMRTKQSFSQGIIFSKTFVSPLS